MPAKRRVRLDGKGEPVAPASPVDDSEPCDCPQLDPAEWHEAENDWSDIQFLRTHIKALAGVPMGFTALKSELIDRALASGATVPGDPMILLGEGRFRRPLLIEIEDAPPDLDGLFEPGGFAFTLLEKAPPGTVGKLEKQAREAAAAKYGRQPDHLWLWYLTCGRCSGERDFETLFVSHFGA